MKRLTISSQACTETLALLIVLAWADGHLDDAEKDGIRAASEVLNLTKELRARLDALLAAPIAVDELLFDTLSPKDRAFAFVAAAWLTGVDGHIDLKEKAVLDRVADKLELSKARQTELAAIARDLTPDLGAKRDWAREVVTLFRAIAPRLEAPGEEVEVTFG